MSKPSPGRKARPVLAARKSPGTRRGKAVRSARTARAKPSWRRRLLRWTLKWSFVASIWLTLALGGMVAWFAYDMPDVDAVEAPVRQIGRAHV